MKLKRKFYEKRINIRISAFLVRITYYPEPTQSLGYLALDSIVCTLV